MATTTIALSFICMTVSLFETKFVSFKIANIQVNGNNNNSIKLYLHDYNKVLQYC